MSGAAPETSPDSIESAAAALRAGRTSSVALVDQALARIDARGAGLNAFITVDADGARRAAREADRERAIGIDRGPLHGIPLSLKDLIDQAGVVTTAASHVLDDRVAADDARVVVRLRHAGAVIIGRTNLHEFALGTTSEDSAYGPVLHPLDPARSAGGSSGGAAAAVASGMGLAALGTDTGGSVRIPSAACGLVGLKPSRGDVPTDGVIPLSTTLDSVGPLARTVQDAAWVWQVLADRLPTTIAPATAGTLVFGRLAGYFDRPLEPPVRHAFERALTRLAGAGVHVRTVTLNDTAAISGAYGHVVLPEAAHWHAPYLDRRADRYQPAVRERILNGRAIAAVDYLAALDACTTLRGCVDVALAACDALVLPTLPLLAPRLGTADLALEPGEHPLPVRTAMLKHTQLFNMTGHPAITLPIPTDTLPVGLQLVGRAQQTERLLAVAACCESILGGR